MKTETHLHTSQVSMCAVMPAEEIVKHYQEAGYKNIIVTDHWNRWTLDQFSGSPREKNEVWLSGYKILRDEAPKFGIHVFLGMEMCLNHGPEDFLIFGLSEEFLREHPNLYEYTLQEVFGVIDGAGLLIFQAHPFRPYLSVQDPAYMHGMEVLNANSGHQNYNDKAKAFAQKHNLLQSAGSDFHGKYEGAQMGGVYLPQNIRTNRQLVDYYKTGKVKLFGA